MSLSKHPWRATGILLVASFLATSCSDDDDDGGGSSGAFALVSIVIDTENDRTTYVQTVESLDDGPFDNTNAIEIPGNGVTMGGGGHFFVGLTEEPTWVRYSLVNGRVEETGRVSFLDYGVARIDYGNAYVDEDTAVSVFSSQGLAIFWNPSTMRILGDVDLSFLAREGYSLEVWTTSAHEGRVYVPARWADWDNGRIYPGVSMTIIDAETRAVLGTAEDDRCASGGRVAFDEDGYAYVMGDGRNYAIHMFARAKGEEGPPPNCLLRIAPGELDFEEGYYYAIPELTGGHESITELAPASDGDGFAFAKMFYEDELANDVEPVDFSFWSMPVHKMWRLELADPPVLQEVTGAPLSAVGFTPVAFDGRLYAGESDDGSTSEVYEMDPQTNTATRRFSMQGYFAGLYELH